MNTRPASEIGEPAPCVICADVIDGKDFDAQNVIALVGKNFVVAHVGHFFDETKKPLPEYEENLTRLALAHGKSEGWKMPNAPKVEL